MQQNSHRENINIELENFLLKIIDTENNPILKSHYLKIRDFVMRDGKRIRPLISLMCYKSIRGVIPESIMLPVLSAELLHAGTLIQDDIMDEDELRRNEPSMHKVMADVFLSDYYSKCTEGNIFKEPALRFGGSVAILHGNILFSLGEKCIFDAGISKKAKEKVLVGYNKTLKTVNEGQILDITFALMQDIGEEEYLDMVTRKTSALFEYSALSGAFLADGSEGQCTILQELSRCLAIAFQIRDDIIDLTDPSLKGHLPGSDIKKGNMTLPIICAIKNSNHEQRKILDKVLCVNSADEIDIQNAIGIIKDTGAIKISERISKREINKAKAILNINKDKFKDLSFFNDLYRGII